MNGHVARVGRIRHAFQTLAENLKERDNMGDIGTDERLTLNWILK